MKFGIRQKLLSGFSAIILIFTIVCLVEIYVIQNVVSSLEHTLAYPVVVSRASQDVEVLVLSIQQKLNNISFSSDHTNFNRQVNAIRKDNTQVLRLFSLIQRQILGARGRTLAVNARMNYNRWELIFNKAISLANNGKYDQMQKANQNEGDSQVRLLQFQLDQIGDYATNRAILDTEVSIQSATNAKITGIVIIGFSILISLIISFSLSLSIIKRLKAISTATTLMAKGNIKQKLEITGQDELSQVAINFNDMANELGSLYENLEKKVRDRTRELNEANEELHHVKYDLEAKVIERTKDLENNINELNRSQLAMLYMIEDMNETSRQLKAAQEELIRKERLAILGEFSGNISHELRNPLGVIDSSIYYLQMRLEEKDEKVRQHLDRISQSVRTATSIIENLLNLTRLNKPILKKHGIRILVSDCLDECQIPDTVTIMKYFPDKELFIMAEKEQIRMAIDNLVKNAVSAMNGTGTLKIGIQRMENGEVEISFADTGNGISSDLIEQIFLPLFTTKAKGIGLGLSITKMIVENHGGKISVESKPGMGARFSIHLPEVSQN
ncbi:MAG: ATP-binding protein [Bacteroidales bacterium]|jgi:signal transduction histidine kinase